MFLALEVRDAVMAICRQTLPREAKVSNSLVKQPPNLFVIVGPIEWDGHEWKSIGNREMRDELKIVINLWYAATKETVDTEALTLGLINDLETNFRANPSLGDFKSGQVINSKFMPEAIETSPLETGSITRFQGYITATCRTTGGK